MFSTIACAGTTEHRPPVKPAAPIARAPEPVMSEGTSVADNTLADAVAAKVGVDEMGPPTVVRAWTWHPHAKERYVVWITCRGVAPSRACGLAVAPASSGNLHVTAFTHLGFATPQVGCASDPTKLEVRDGSWTQLLELERDGTLKVGKRTYSSNHE
jgi:hypothetical protein